MRYVTEYRDAESVRGVLDEMLNERAGKTGTEAPSAETGEEDQGNSDG